jgi:DNA-binding transcriptional regulator YiaG
LGDASDCNHVYWVGTFCSDVWRLLARLQTQDKEMTPAEFTALRNALGLSHAKLGEVLGLTSRAIRYYESGERRIPKPVEMALNAYARMTKEK